jgi:HSP20 family protein
MKTLARWSPFRELAPFTAFPELETMFGEYPFRPLAGSFEPVPMMRIDVTENNGNYTVKAEIPGMKKEDIAVSIDGNTVSIVAETKHEKEWKEGEKLLRSERYYGSLSRMLTLPVEVDPAKADASYDNGVLTLVLPKAAGVEARRLAVH